MKEVKRYYVPDESRHDLSDGPPVDIEYGSHTEMVSAQDFDSIVKELEGKLKVATDALESITCCANGSTGMPGSKNYNPQKLVNECIETADEALAQIGDGEGE